MRKFMLMALALVIGTASLFAANTVEDTPKKEIRNQIVDMLAAPDFSIDEDVYVTLIFTFNSEGEIVVLSVDTKRHDILQYIRKNLNHQIFQNPGERDKVYSLSLKVKQA